MAIGIETNWNPDSARARFCSALSEMYKQEVPLYGDLIDIVDHVDNNVFRARSIRSQGTGPSTKDTSHKLPPRHRVERHGAIRLGTPYELQTIRRLFAVFGMYPVGYYDLSVVGFPLHATAFRPVQTEALEKHPFRVFTTLLRHDLLSSEIRIFVQKILSKRNLFSDRLLELVGKLEKHHSLSSAETDELLAEALKIFKWHSAATVTFDEYQWLNAEHAMVADIASFPSAHINHLTPRTLDIDLVQKTMVERGIPAKERVEGPPRQKCGILLRQTSFKALREPVRFHSDEGGWVDRTHTARFGEIEQRGAAVTRKGRALYDRLLSEAYLRAHDSSAPFDEVLESTFHEYPDDWTELRCRGLIFVRYKPTTNGLEAFKHGEGKKGQQDLSKLLEQGFVDYDPITYEDFLPVSAAGIFTSNLKRDSRESFMTEGKPDRVGFEQSLGVTTADEFELYEKTQNDSLEECRRALGIDGITPDYC